jgi:hypothetical protein
VRGFFRGGLRPWLLRCPHSNRCSSNGIESLTPDPSLVFHTRSNTPTHTTKTQVFTTTGRRRQRRANEAPRGGRSGGLPFLVLGFPAAPLPLLPFPAAAAAAAAGTTEARVVHQDLARPQGSRGIADGWLEQRGTSVWVMGFKWGWLGNGNSSGACRVGCKAKLEGLARCMQGNRIEQLLRASFLPKAHIYAHHPPL